MRRLARSLIFLVLAQFLDCAPQNPPLPDLIAEALEAEAMDAMD